MLYKNCRELPYHNFNEVQVDNSLIYLIKDKDIYKQFELLLEIEQDENTDLDDEQQLFYLSTISDLERHWIEILDEYFKLTNDFSQSKFFKDRSELLYLETKKEILEALFKIKDIEFSTEQRNLFDSILKKYRVTDIERSILGTNDDINLKINQLKKVTTNEKKSNFDETLAAMRMNGVSVNRHEVTVSEFIAMVNMMKRSGAKGKNNTRAK